MLTTHASSSIRTGDQIRALLKQPDIDLPMFVALTGIDRQLQADILDGKAWAEQIPENYQKGVDNYVTLRKPYLPATAEAKPEPAEECWQGLPHKSAPPELTHLDQWVCWTAVSKSDGSTTKVPKRDADHNASSTDPKTWTDYSTARGIYDESEGRLAGVGFVLTAQDPYLALDWDHVIDADGNLDPEVDKALNELQTYAERSPSGHGVRAFVRADKPEGLKNSGTLQFWTHARFITVTGHTIFDLPIAEPDPALLREVMARFGPQPPTQRQPQSSTHAVGFDYGEAVSAVLRGDLLHDSLRDLAASQAAFGVPPHVIEALLTGILQNSAAIKTARGKERLGEIPKLVESAFEKFGVSNLANQTPIDLFEQRRPPAFPTDILPRSVRDYVEDQASRMGCDPALLAMFGLAVAAGAITDDIKIQPKRHDPTWQESPRVWVAACTEVSGGKTPAMKAMALPVFEQEKIWRPQSNSDKDDYRYQCEQARKNGDPLPPRPVCHRAVTDDITIDKLGDILSYTNRGTLVLKDELSEFFASMDTYGNRKGGRDRAAYLSAYNGGPRTIDRVTRGELYVENFSICICGGIQPAKIQEMQNSLQDDGLLERFNIFHTRPPVKGHDRPKEQDFLPGYLKLIERLYALKAGEAPVLYSDDAIRYQEQIEQIALDFATSTTFPPRLCSHAGKWKGQFARYALVLHAMECVENGTFTNIIEKETVAKVARLFETFLIPNAMLFFDGENVTNEPLEHAKWLAGWILSRSLTEVSRRDMQRSYRDVRNDPGALRKATKLLEDFGWIAPKKTVRNETTAWHVNPQVHVLFQARAVEEARRRDETRRYLETVFKTAN